MSMAADRDWGRARRTLGRVFTASMCLLAILSLVRVDFERGWSGRFEVTPTTALFVALSVAPFLVERLVERGGSLRLPGGMEVDLDERSMRDVGLPGLAVTKQVVEARLGALEGKYERWRSAPSNWARTQQLEGLLAEARLLAGAASDRMGDRMRGFESATDGERAITLGLVEGALGVPGETAAALLHGLLAPRSSFEEYHLLVSCELHLPHLPAEKGHALLQQITLRLEDRNWAPRSDRRTVARRILEQNA